MKPGCIAVLTSALVLAAPDAGAQHRYTTEAVVGLDHLPYLVNDLDLAIDTWRSLGFRVRPGSARADGLQNRFVEFGDGSVIELLAVPETAGSAAEPFRVLLSEAEGPAFFSFRAREMTPFRAALKEIRFEYDDAAETVTRRGLDFFRFGEDLEVEDTGSLSHPNGATALSRLWIALPRGDANDLKRLLVALGGEATGAKVYAPEAVQTTVVTVSNGEVLILPQTHQLTRTRPIIGVTFEVEDLDALRRRLTDFGIAFAAGGVQGMSVIVAPDVTHGMWVEFRE